MRNTAAATLTRLVVLLTSQRSSARSAKDLKFGETLGAGAFGTVRRATALLDGVTTQVAVKTLTFTEQDDFKEKLEEFTQEATVGWAVSSRARNGVRPCIR